MEEGTEFLDSGAHGTQEAGLKEQGRSPSNDSDDHVAGERTPLHFTIGTALRSDAYDEPSLEVEVRLIRWHSSTPTQRACSARAHRP